MKSYYIAQVTIFSYEKEYTHKKLIYFAVQKKLTL